MALGISRSLISFSLLSAVKRHHHSYVKLSKKSTSIRVLPGFRPLCTATTTAIEPPDELKHSMLLERLRVRHLKDSNKQAPKTKPQESVNSAESGDTIEEFGKNYKKNKKAVSVGSFEELGLSEEVMGAVREMGIEVPTEVQCIGVPAILDENSVALGSHTGSGKTLAYMLPLVQVNFSFFCVCVQPSHCFHRE